MQVIGLCRFSYPAIGGFQIEHETLAEREAYLYAPARMEERLRLFESVALPALKAQSDADFRFIVLIGKTLPDQYRSRLEDLLADMPQARILAKDPGKMRDVMKRAINAERGAALPPCLQFRHDDDDAVSVDFIERLRSAARDCAGLLKANGSVAIDFSRGYTAAFGGKGITASETYRPWLGVALAMYTGRGVARSIFNFAHNKLPQHMPTVAFSDAPMWLRGHNDHNDSRQGPTVKPVELQPLTPAQVQEFEARFAIRDADLRRAFSAS